MRIVIVGPGALGSLLTARFYIRQQECKNTADNDIHSLVLLDYRPERAQFLREKGLILEEGDDETLYWPEISTSPDICEKCDVIFFCVKATAVQPALQKIRPFLSRRQLLVAMQNGIGHLETVSSAGCPAAVGITSEGATLVRPGHIRFGGKGLTRLGLLTGHPDNEQKLSTIVALINSAGMKAELTSDPHKHIWAKLFVNIGINPLTALYGCRNGELLDNPSALDKLKAAVREAEAVAKAKGIPVYSDPVAATLSVCRSTFHNTSSMLQDVQQKRQTEIDSINGAVAAEGKKLGIATPVNAELVSRIKELEAKYAEKS